MTAMWGPESIWTALLTALLITHCSQPAAAQKSVPVTTTNDFANALKDQTITEIILDPSGTGVRVSVMDPSGFDMTKRAYRKLVVGSLLLQGYSTSAH